MARLTVRATAGALLVSSLLAGCVGGGDGFSVDGGVDRPDALYAVGRVVDQELFPVADAVVVLVEGDVSNTTASDGSFRLGPLEPGTFTVVVEKTGYLRLEQQITLGAGARDPFLFTLAPGAITVPHHDTFVHVAFLDCSWAALSATFPCLPIDRVTGQNVTGDPSEWSFTIEKPGLANVLHEMRWQEQTTGKDMKIVITDPGEAVFVGGVSNFYLSHIGGTPLRSWLDPGKEAVGANAPFDVNVSKEYRAFIRGSESNMTVPVAALYIEHRAENWFTFFYNREGPRSFTALPDE